jgi:hypothetical protein
VSLRYGGNVPNSTFGERFEYAVFLYHLEHGRAPGNAEIGKAVGRKGQAVTLWSVREAPPPDYRDGKPLHVPLAAFFGVDRTWLIDNDGEPPRPDLWRDWITKRRAQREAGKRTSTPRRVEVQPRPPETRRAVRLARPRKGRRAKGEG